GPPYITFFTVEFNKVQTSDEEPTLAIDTPHQFASSSRRRNFTKEGVEQPPQPVRPGTRAYPTVQLGGIQVVHVQIDLPTWRGLLIGFWPFFDAPRPIPAKALHPQQAGGAAPVAPTQPGLLQFQGLVETGDGQRSFVHGN